MGLSSTPQESAPAYDDVFNDHPVNQFAPTGSASAYAAVPQEDVELHAHHHPSSAPTPVPAPQETPLQTIAGLFRPKSGPHVHCEQCDKQLEARERRENQKHCCSMVAWVFIIAFICMMILGIFITANVTKANRHRH